MKIYFATDHAGYELKNELLEYVSNELGYDVVDEGAHKYDKEDDYPDFVHKAAHAVSEDTKNRRAIILGWSGQGEAIVANRYKGVRAIVYNAVNLDIIKLSREHNDANILSLGAGFISTEDAKGAVRLWFEEDFSGVERHARRIKKIDDIIRT